MIPEVEDRNGWIWPKSDSNCWSYMQKYPTLPHEITRYVNDKDIVIQAGGNCGFYTKQYAKLFNKVYTFEPEWLNFYCLNLNVPESNLIKNQSCLGDTHQLVDLAIKEKNRGKNFVKGIGKYPTYRIDDLNLENCSLIHLDVEGYELFAVRGALKTIKKYKPVVVLEMWDQLDDRYVPNSNAEILNLMQSLGYKHVHTFYESDRVFIS